MTATADRACIAQSLEAGKRLFEPWPPAPMQEIEINPVGLEPPQASFTIGDNAGARGVLWQHLGHDKAFVTPPFDGFSDDLLGDSVAIHLGGVDQRKPEIDAEPKRRDLFFSHPYAFAQAPCALPKLRHPLTRGKSYGGTAELWHDAGQGYAKVRRPPSAALS
jgi:hypothetical protein